MKDTRQTILIRPVIVLVVRIGTYIVRAIEAKGNYSEGLFIAEQILLLLGLLPLASTLVALLDYHVKRNWIPTPAEPKRKAGLSRFLRLLELALVAAVVLGVLAGIKISSAMNDPASLDSLKTYRCAVIGLTLGVIVLMPLLAAFETMQEGLPLRSCLVLFGGAGLLMRTTAFTTLVIPSVYRLVVTLHPVSPRSSGSKTAFYLLSALPEWLCVVLLLALNLESLFAIREAGWKARVGKKMKTGDWTGSYVPQDDMAYEMSHNEYKA